MKVRDALAPAAAVLLLFAGYFKGNPLLAGLPADLTLVAASCVAVGIFAVFITRHGLIPKAAMPVLLLWACFIPGWFLASSNPYAAEKGARLFTLTLVAALAPAYLIVSKRRQKWWVWLHGVVGLLVVLAAQVTPAAETGLFELEGSDTIAAGRATGGALVVALLLLFTRSAPVLIVLPLALIMAGPLVASGSRGPVLAAITAVLFVGATAPMGARQRATRAMFALGAVVTGAVLFAQDGAGSARIEQGLFAEPLAQASSQARLLLWRESIQRAAAMPEGVGWGDFFDVQRYSATVASGYTQYAHNVILETLVEGGWLAGIATVVFAIAAIRRLRRAAVSGYESVFYGLAVFALVNGMVSGDVNDNRMMWAALAFAWVLPSASMSGERPGDLLDHRVVADRVRPGTLGSWSGTAPRTSSRPGC